MARSNSLFGYLRADSMNLQTFLLVCALSRFCGTLANAVCRAPSTDIQSRIGLLVSPLVDRRNTIYEIEIYWNNMDYQEGDKIGIFTEEPSNASVPVYTVRPSGPSGYEKTGLQAEFVPSSNLSFSKQCLKHRVAWLRDGSIKVTNCLRTQPNWMQEMRNTLGHLTMSEIFLPGTHNSGAYVRNAEPSKTMEDYFMKYAITQDSDVLSQLIHGVRYLDIRVGYYPSSKDVWWINHWIIQTVPLQSVVDQVKTFLDNTQEIVIFDVQEFPIGFSGMSDHARLVEYLQKEFAGYLHPKSYGWESTLNSIWSSGRRLIIGYDHQRVVARYEDIWPCVKHQWGDVRTIDDLYEYLNRIETTDRGLRGVTPRSAMAELTPDALDVVLDRLGGLRAMAHNVNINVTNWYSSIWQDTANIVAVDFVRGTGIVETAIESNKQRNCPPSD